MFSKFPAQIACTYLMDQASDLTSKDQSQATHIWKSLGSALGYISPSQNVHLSTEDYCSIPTVEYLISCHLICLIYLISINFAPMLKQCLCRTVEAIIPCGCSQVALRYIKYCQDYDLIRRYVEGYPFRYLIL